MKLYKKDIKQFDDGSIISVYGFEKIQDLEELKKFLLLIKNQYGNLENINVAKDIGNNKLTFYCRYNDLDEFCKKYVPQNFNDYNMYEFSGKNSHFKIDILKNLIDIYQDNNKNIEELDDYEYYIFETGLIVRYNNTNRRFDYLSNENKWINDDSLIDLIYDPAYKYEIIDDPLETKNK